jgi:hypothetical protein
MGTGKGQREAAFVTFGRWPTRTGYCHAHRSSKESLNQLPKQGRDALSLDGHHTDIHTRPRRPINGLPVKQRLANIQVAIGIDTIKIKDQWSNRSSNQVAKQIIDPAMVVQGCRIAKNGWKHVFGYVPFPTFKGCHVCLETVFGFKFVKPAPAFLEESSRAWYFHCDARRWYITLTCPFTGALASAIGAARLLAIHHVQSYRPRTDQGLDKRKHISSRANLRTCLR